MTPEEIIVFALAEDVGNGDHTSLATIPPDAYGKAKLIVKQPGIISGIAVARLVFQHCDASIIMHQHISDGEAVKPGDIAFTVEGPSVSILTAERLVLNFMQRMSGIATTTRKYVHAINGLKTKVLDTRKTTPMMRWFEKQAVVHGGGTNHRFGLYDMMMIKDNHVDFSGGIQKAILAAQQYQQKSNLSLQIEIEVRSLSELEEVLLSGGVHRIMLDNFDPDLLRQAVKRINGAYETEASGGITLDTIRSYAETGVDFISVGALTHQITSLDMSLKAI